MDVSDQPLSVVEWVDPTMLQANDYNPNRVAVPEMRLLKLSILENGWTQPIVAHPSGEIVDGFHRWMLASKDEEVRALTGGLCPVVRLRGINESEARLATIRHNRARGSHYIVQMAEIVNQLCDAGMENDEIMFRLGMEEDEVVRLRMRGNSLIRNAQTEFGQGWEPGEKMSAGLK